MSTITSPRQRGLLEEGSDMIPTDPPPWVVRATGWLVVTIFGTALVAAIVVRLPETVQCPFVLVPKDGADPLKAPLMAEISEVRVTEAQAVAEGEELFVLRSDEIRSRRTQLQTADEDLRARTDSIAKMEISHGAQLSIKDAEIVQIERELSFRKKHTDTSRELVVRLGKLALSGGISQIEMARLQLDLAGSEKDLSVTEKNLEAARLDRNRLETERERQRSDELAVVQNLKSKIDALHRDLAHSHEDYLSIRAPYAAVVVSLSHRTRDDVVPAGEELCQLAHIDATPHARLVLGETGLSRLAQGQRARLFFDAFPYQRYGTITGVLDWISPAAIAAPGGPQFIARTSLDQNFIRVKGEPRPLRVGMKGEARIVVGNRSLIEYAFEPIRQLRENMRP
jgi:multidrug resistance efflux pump